MNVRSQILAQDFISKETDLMAAVINRNIDSSSDNSYREILQSRLKIYAQAYDINDDQVTKSVLKHISKFEKTPTTREYDTS